jgi:hypothetical protein
MPAAAYRCIVQQTPLMFNLFRPRMPRKRSSLQFISINGNTYLRRQSDIIRLEPGDVAGDGKVCDAHHVAPNGASIAQIAYAIALIEGRIAILDNPSYSQPSSPTFPLGLN